MFSAPVSVPKEATEVYYHYYKTIYYLWDIPSLYASFFYFHFIFVFILVGSVNFMKRVGHQDKLSNKWINWYRRNITLPALFSGKHAEPAVFVRFISTLFPTRVETLIIFFFICLNVLLTAVHYDVDTLYESL